MRVFRSVAHIYAQVIDDTRARNGLGVPHGADVKPAFRQARRQHQRRQSGRQYIAKRPKEKGIERVVFDRGGFLYHGRVRAVADAAREAGLEF